MATYSCYWNYFGGNSTIIIDAEQLIEMHLFGNLRKERRKKMLL